MEEKVKLMLIEYGTALGIVIALIAGGILDASQWSWITPLIISLVSSVFLIQFSTNHIPTLVKSLRQSEQPKEAPVSTTPQKQGELLDKISGTFDRLIQVVDSQLMREIEEEHHEEKTDPEIKVIDEELADVGDKEIEDKIRDFLSPKKE